jgi:glycosyltransferase involved in cell wall biosynthesis
VRHGVTGLVVARPRDVASVAFALDRVLGDPTRRREMGAAARRRAVDAFTYDMLATRLSDALQEVAVGRPAGESGRIES